MTNPNSATQILHSRRTVLLGGLSAGLLTACSHVPSLNSAKQTIDLLRKRGDEYPRTREQVDAEPYAQLGVRIGSGPKGIMVLSQRQGEDLLWTSANRVLIATRGNRIIQTVGLPLDLRRTELVGPDIAQQYDLTPQSLLQMKLQRIVDVMPGEQFQVPIDSTVVVEGDETVQILGQSFETLRVREDVHCEQWRWKARNYFWLSKRSGLAWRSQQSLHPDAPRIELEVLKRPG